MSASDPAITAWTPPPLSECDPVQRLNVPLDEIYTLSTRRVLWNSQLVAYAIVLSRKVGDRNIEVVCIDTMHHDCVHRHDGDHESPYREIRPIYTQEDVQDSYPESYDEVYNVYLRSMGLEELR